MRIKPIAFVAVVAALTAYILFADVGSTALVRAGSEAPDFKVKTLDGRQVSLSDFRGSVVFLNFWSTSCEPCEAEMPDLNAVAERFKGRKFQMMPVSLDLDPDDVDRFYAEQGLTMPAYLDPGQNAAEKFDILGTPETFIIDPSGKVAKYYFGPWPWTSPQMIEQLEAMIP